MPEAFKLPFLKKEQIARDTYSFYFKRDERFEFIAGQYIKMTLPIEQPDERGTSRLFTIASSPLEKEHIQITTRIIQSSYKKKLVALTPGEQIQFFGPMGTFVFDEKEMRPQVFLAGGIGITPFHSMISFAAAHNYPAPIILFASFSISDDVVFQNELQDINASHPNIQSIFTVTQPGSSTKPWGGETGRISESLIKKYIQNIKEPLYKIVGPPQMVEAMEALIISMGVQKEQVKIENFVGY